MLARPKKLQKLKLLYTLQPAANIACIRQCMLGIIWFNHRFNREIKKVDFVEESISINFVNILVDFFRFSFVIMLFFKKPEINGLIT